jgi:hypothetical protein
MMMFWLEFVGRCVLVTVILSVLACVGMWPL